MSEAIAETEEVEGVEEAEQETPVAETEEAEEFESESSMVDEQEEETEENEEEEVEELEFDFGGTKHSVRKNASVQEIAEPLQAYAKNIEADYTRKSQDLADNRKSLEARAEAIQKLENLHGETLDEYSQGLALRNELTQLSQVDMQSLWQSDPDQARKLSDAISQKQAQFNSILTSVSQKEQTLQTERQKETGRLVELGKQAVEKLVPGFEAQHAPAVKDYVKKTFNVSDSDADNWAINPNGAIMAYESMLYRQMKAKANKPRPVSKKVSAPVKPIVKGKRAKASVRPGDMSPDEYEKWFTAKQSKP